MLVRFSVVVTCYNYAAYVCEAVDSALMQTQPAAEIIVIDDGSTDDSLARLRSKYRDSAVVRILSQENQGQLASFVAGCRAATGEIICFLDADDCWEADYLSCLHALYASASAPDMVLSNLRRFGSRDEIWHPQRQDKDLGLGVIQAWALHVFPVAPTSSISMTRLLAARVLELPDSYFPQWRVRADDCLLIGANILGARSWFVSHPYVRYRVHGDNQWWGRSLSKLQVAFYSFRVSSMAEYYGARAGLSVRHFNYSFYEFRTKSHPTTRELFQYIWLQWHVPRPWIERVRPTAAIAKHYFLSRFRTIP